MIYHIHNTSMAQRMYLCMGPLKYNHFRTKTILLHTRLSKLFQVQVHTTFYVIFLI